MGGDPGFDDAAESADDGSWARLLRNRARLDRVAEIQAEINRLEAEKLTLIGEVSRDYAGIHEFLPSEVGPLLAIPETEANQLIHRAGTLTVVLPRTLATLAAGEITTGHAFAVADAVQFTTAEVADRVDAFITRRFAAGACPTWRQTSRAARGKVKQWDLKDDKKQREHAIGDRCLSRRLCSNGMASLRVYAKAEQIAVMWDATTMLADAAAVPGDTRDLGNRRVDVLGDLFASILDTGSIPVLPEVVDLIEHPIGATVRPTDLDFDAETGDSSADNGVGQTLDPSTGLRRGVGGRAARRALATAAHSDNDSDGARSRSRRRAKARRSVLVNVTMPITALLGDDNAVCELDGWGPITAEHARIIAADAELRRIICDPATGQVLDVGQTRYAPPRHLVEHVKVRDRTCLVPGCDQPAVRCDIDHRRPFSQGGHTSACNLGCLCRHHHRAKDGGEFTLTKTDDGYLWTTPVGRQYRRPFPTLWEPGDQYWPENMRHPEFVPDWARDLVTTTADTIRDAKAATAETVETFSTPAGISTAAAMPNPDDPPPF